MDFLLEQTGCALQARLQLRQLRLHILLETAERPHHLRPGVLLCPPRPGPLDGVAQLRDDAQVGHQTSHGRRAAPAVHVGRGELARKKGCAGTEFGEHSQILRELAVRWEGLRRIAAELLLGVSIEPKKLLSNCGSNLRVRSEDVEQGRRTSLLHPNDHKCRETVVRQVGEAALRPLAPVLQQEGHVLDLCGLPGQKASGGRRCQGGSCSGLLNEGSRPNPWRARRAAAR
mmetsp:Transcript_75946/g.226400  ORF Transcript_75946/g.226400 Transcript_75946/m.226400 type:complete len:230 (+) Transcript_75946:388-1077(+)